MLPRLLLLARVVVTALQRWPSPVHSSALVQHAYSPPQGPTPRRTGEDVGRSAILRKQRGSGE